MAKRVFFSFHYQDVIDFRANVVRQHWVTKDREEAGYFDASMWENAKKTGKLEKLIDDALNGTTVTCVLIGTQTFARPWVRYEIVRSMQRGNRLFGVHINGIKDKNGTTKPKGNNPFDYLGVKYSDDGKSLYIYEWVTNSWNSYEKLPGYSFSEAATARAGKFFQLSAFSGIPAYEWLQDDGFDNFSTWVG